MKTTDLEAEVKRLRQGLWQCAVEAGVDTDGDTTYHGTFPDIVDFAVAAVKDLRECYEEVLSDDE